MNFVQNRTPCYSSALHSGRSLNEVTPYKDRYLPSIKNLPARMAIVAKKPARQCQPDTNNKWYKEPKIPVQLNSSTLIRRKTNTSSGLDEVLKKETNNQLALNALTFLKRDQRASDLVNEKYEIMPKGMKPFNKSSYIKDVLAKIVSSGDHASLQESKAIHRPAANPSGDACGVDQSGIYHRVSALSINDLKSGCNVKYFEEVSFQAKTSTTTTSVKKHNLETEVVTRLENVRTMAQCTREWNPTIKSEIVSKFSNSYQAIDQNNATSEDDDDSRQNVIVKKKDKKSKKPVVITCLKNSTVKYIRRK